MVLLNHLPFPKDIRAKSIEQLTELLKQASKNRVGEKRARKLKETIHRSRGRIRGSPSEVKVNIEEVSVYKDELEKYTNRWRKHYK